MSGPFTINFDRDSLLREATLELNKKLPKALASVPFDRLPTVHWADTSEPVAPEILRWFLVLSYKLKTIEPGSMLRHYVGAWREREAERYGQFALEQWLVAGTVAQKGILAVAACCCGRASVPLIGNYLNKWYGKRAQHCKTLIHLLASFVKPGNLAAIQLLLAVDNYFRTRAIQEEASKHVDLLVARLGVTREELADRAIPDAGLDQKGELRLDYGVRKFIVRLNKDCELTISDGSGKTIKLLPPAWRGEDGDRVQAAKAQLAEAQAELKQVLAVQGQRLYQAMCTEHEWRFADWEKYLNRHAIMSRLCQRLIWAVCGQERYFRPRADGTLTDAGDNVVTVEPGAKIRLAHASMLVPGVWQQWQRHFADYELVPLFELFERQPYHLSETARADNRIKDFEGYLISAFTLRNSITKLGYQRGFTFEGLYFFFYKKAFPRLKLYAVIDFSGNEVLEKDGIVALGSLYFITEEAGLAQEDDEYPEQVPIANVPAILISEIYNDMRTIAAQGSGYDAQWRHRIDEL